MSRMADSLGMPPEPYDGNGWQKRIPVGQSNVTFHQPGRGSEGHRTSANRSKSGFNLRGVCEVLAEFGLDPVEQLARVLQERKPLIDSSTGEPLKDSATGQVLTQFALPIDLRTKVLVELTNFVHPKLKAVEMTVKKPELTEDQVEARLVELLNRQQKKALD